MVKDRNNRSSKLSPEPSTGRGIVSLDSLPTVLVRKKRASDKQNEINGGYAREEETINARNLGKLSKLLSDGNASAKLELSPVTKKSISKRDRTAKSLVLLRGRINRKKHDISERVSHDIDEFARTHSFDKEDSVAEWKKFIDQKIPELQLISEFRNLAEPKPLFPGRRGGIDPFVFLTDHYGDEIARGALGPGALQARDQNLYSAINDKLLRGEKRQTMQEFFDSMRAKDDLPTLADIRFEAASKAVGLTTEQFRDFLKGIVRTEKRGASIVD